MRVSVKQGINFSSPYTTIIGEFDSTPTPLFFDELKNLHEVFLIAYSIEENKVEVQSKFPHFWKEAFKVLNLYFAGHNTEAETREFIYDALIKMQIGSMSSIPVYQGAQKLRIELTQFYFHDGLHVDYDEKPWNKKYVVGCGIETELMAMASSSKDSKDGLKAQRDKAQTNQIITRLGLPIAKWEIVNSIDHLATIWDNYKKPVVIKPAGLTRGLGVVTNIFELDHAVKSVAFAQKAIDTKARSEWQKKIMIQEQVAGNDYRLLVVNGKLEIATHRIPAYVMGDGKSTIRELITETNKDPRRNTGNPTHILKPINFDEMLDQYLNEQGLTLESVPKKGEQQFVRKIASMSMGGMTKDVTDTVHPQIRYFVESLAQTVKSFVIGVDVICKDISNPLTAENGSFIEMNSQPEMYLNAFPTDGKQYNHIGETYVKGLLEGKPRTKRISIIGGTLNEAKKVADNEIKAGHRVGLYSNNSIFINNELMNDGLNQPQAIESIKINGSLETIILHYSDRVNAESMGLGFDEIDELIIKGELEKSQKEIVKKYQQIGLIKKVS